MTKYDELIAWCKEQDRTHPDADIMPMKKIAAALTDLQAQVAGLRGALLECSNVLADIPAPIHHALWCRMVNAMKSARQAMEKSNG